MSLVIEELLPFDYLNLKLSKQLMEFHETYPEYICL